MNDAFREELNHWNSYEYKALKVYFPENSPIAQSAEQWSKDRYAAFSTICGALGVAWKKKDVVKIYVFNNKAHGKKFGYKLGFSRAKYKEVFTLHNQSKGHELTHVISWRMNKAKIVHSALIQEGTATYFDHTNRNFDQISKRILEQNNDALKIFGPDFRKQPGAYSLGASFVGFLMNRYSMDTFIQYYSQDRYSEKDGFMHFYQKDQLRLYGEWVAYLSDP